jgi:hypothetical protein
LLCLSCAGQHFLAHEDGFPGAAALEKGYNRRATLLVYLNDVPQVSNGGDHYKWILSLLNGTLHTR